MQRLRDEVEKERTGRKKAVAAKKQAERERDDAVARLVAAQGGRPMATVEEGAPPEEGIPEGDPLAKTDSQTEFGRAEAEAWDGEQSTNQLTNERTTASAERTAVGDSDADAHAFLCVSRFSLHVCVHLCVALLCCVVCLQMRTLASCLPFKRRRTTRA